MRLDQDPNKNLIRLFMHVVDKAAQVSATVMDFGTGERLSQAEIHMIAAIGAREGIHALSLAAAAGVTRGAVSQLLHRLEAKGFIKREEDPENRSRRLLFLTKKGKRAERGHESFHKRFDHVYLGILGDLGAQKVEDITAFLEAVAAKLAELP